MSRPVSHYPLFIDLRGRRCVVLGDSPVAAEKAAGLRDAGARVVHHRRPFRDGDLRGARLAVEASGDPAAEARARAEADREGVLLNVVDVPSRCDWIAPAVVRRGPLQVAISTSGESPLLAAAWRRRIEALIGEEWGPLTAMAGRLRRQLRRHGVPLDRQRRAQRRLLGSQARDLLASGQAAAAEACAAGIAAAALGTGPDAHEGRVTLVGAGPGDPGLLTRAGLEALLDAEVVVHDALVSPAILALCPSGARLVDAGKRGGRASTAQGDIDAFLVEQARAGREVVRLKGGDPFVFGRGGEEVKALRSAGIATRVIPGVSSATAAAAAAGIPLTHRGLAGSVAIVSGQRAGGAADTVERLAAAADTLVVLMPCDVAALTARLRIVLGESRPAALVAAATTPAQRTVRAPLGGLAAAARSAGIGAPAVLVCGEVVDLLAEGSVPASALPPAAGA
ncbi:MAG: uroporphyrinogen-III C-methyltransferase [Candidatus Dormibacteria bacterium]